LAYVRESGCTGCEGGGGGIGDDDHPQNAKRTFGDGIDARGETSGARGVPMPLITMADLGHHNKNRDIVRFFMQNESAPSWCD
jgi:hypothetical protein